MNDLLKVSLANKATLAGYMLAPSSAIGTAVALIANPEMDPQQKAGILIAGAASTFAGYILTAMTDFGRETLEIYLRTKKELEDHARLLEIYERKCNTYCGRVGVQLAIKEASLEKLLD